MDKNNFENERKIKNETPTPKAAGARPAPSRTPTRVPEKRNGAKKKTAVRATPSPKQQKRADAREYSFATSSLFNNELQPRKTDATAASEGKRNAPTGQMTAQVTQPIPSSRTRSIPRRPSAGGKRRAERAKAPQPPQNPAVNPQVQGGAQQPTPVRGQVRPQAGMPARATTPPPMQGQGQVGARPPVQNQPMANRPPMPGQPAMPPMQGQGQVPPMPGQGPIPGRVPTRPQAGEFSTKVAPAVKEGAAIAKKQAGEETGWSRPIKKIGSTFSAMSSISRSLIYIASVLLISILLSYIIITNANDIFAFVKDEKTATITIEPGTDLNELSNILKEEGIINHKNTFRFFIKFRNKDSDSYAPGTYTVSSTMSYDQIIAAITPKVEREMVRITIPEGFTVENIIDLFVEKGMGTKEEFTRVINEGDFSSYWFVNELPQDPQRYYRLEGYLVPDTYYFYTDMSEDTIIRKFLDNFESKFTTVYRDDYLAKTVNPLTGKPFTVDEIVTLGSIIQAEGKERTVTIKTDDPNKSGSYVDYGLISSVFHNRMSLKNPMKLQSDATTQFAMDMDGIKDAKLSDYTNPEYTNPYNTYFCQGLPPGAVCNPGLNAISFALFPENMPYYYFVSDSAGNTYFSKTVDEHNAKVAELKNK